MFKPRHYILFTIVFLVQLLFYADIVKRIMSYVPGIVWGMTERDFESALFTGDYFKLVDYLLDKGNISNYTDREGKFSYVMPNGKILKLPKDALVSFSNYVEVAGTDNAADQSRDALGYLTGFYTDSKYYASVFNNGRFTGYFNKAEKFPETNYSNLVSEKVVAVKEFKKCNLQIYQGIYDVVAIDDFSTTPEIKMYDDTKTMIGVKSVGQNNCIDCSLAKDKKPESMQALLNEYERNPNGSNIDALAAKVSESAMTYFLCVDQRFGIIKNIANGTRVDDEDETSIVRLIRSTPTDQAAALINKLDSDKTGLLQTLYGNIDGEELDDFFGALNTVYKNSKSIATWEQLYNELNTKAENFTKTHNINDCNFYTDLAKASNYILVRYVGTDGTNKIKFGIPTFNYHIDTDGKVAFDMANLSCLTTIIQPDKTFGVRPFDLVKIVDLDATKTEAEGRTKEYYAPAINLTYVARNADNLKLATAVNKLIVTLASARLLTPGGSAWGYIWANVDLVVGSGNLYIIQNQDAINKTAAGKKFVQKFQEAQKWIFIAQGISAWYGIGKNLVKFEKALAELKTAYHEWKYADLETLRVQNPELAAKLEAFGKEGIEQLDNLIAEYEIAIQDIQFELKCTREEAQRILQEIQQAGDIAKGLTGALKYTYYDIIRYGGSTVENNGVLKLLNSNGNEVAQISNGKILPTKYFKETDHAGATAIGQPANGYQVFKKGDDLVVKRMPDKSAYSQAELDALSDHSNAHVLERHGHDVTDEALIKRSGTPSTAPDGDFRNNPPSHSSKFESAEKLKDALNNTKPGTANFNPPANGNIYAFDYPLTGQASTPFGYGIPAGGGNPVQMYKVQVVYKKENGIWKLYTMYPKL
jgi:hypothetical protein